MRLAEPAEQLASVRARTATEHCGKGERCTYRLPRVAMADRKSVV